MSRTFAAQLRPSTLPVSFVRKSAAALLLIALLSNTVPVFAVPVLSGSFGSSGQKQMTPVLNFDRTPEPFVIGKKASLSFSEQILGTFTGMVVALRGKAEEIRGRVEDASETESGNAEISTPPQPAAVVDFDFDGDGKADPGRWNSAAASYRIRQSSNGSFVDHQIGSSSAKAAPGDFDGDGKTDPASFDAGTWTIKQSSNSQTVTFSFGQSGDIPMVGDFDGDGEDDAAVFRPSNSTWYVRESSTTNTVTTQFGQTGDVPVSGDFDGDGKADIAVYRPSTGYWWVQQSRDGLLSLQWGVSTDVAVPADFDGDGKTDPAVFRPSTGTWYVLKSIGGYANNIIQGWGNYADQPVPADYDGDGKADFAVWRPSTGVWHIRKSYDSSTANYGVGVAGDVAVASAYVKQVGGSLAPYELAKERLKPRNATGGTDLYSQNFAWGRSLVGLSGRAGLDVGLGLSYNSLVWTKENNTLYFDTNVDNVSPGFRLGFPTIEPAYFVPGGIASDPYWAYVMVTPSGGRVEFKQSGVTKYFETADSSYLQLEADAAPDPNIPVDDINLTLRGTDGSVLKFVWAGGAFRCSEIKDRNGNYIEIEHDELGLLRTITDTLGREIDVNYDSELFPTSISQSWKTNNGEYAPTTHNWAEFEYTTIYPDTDFASSLAVAGPPNGWPVKVLHRVIYPDDSFTVFHYNDYAQVWKVENFAADDTLLNHVRTDLQTPTADQPDVPRFTETRSWVQNFNGGNETKVTFERTPNSSFSLPGSISGTGLLIEAAMDNDPYASVTKTWIGETGWKEGLPLASEDHAAPVEGGTVALQRWSWTNWTQDDVNASEQMNPRVVETRIGDDANTKRTTVEYLEYENTDTAIFGLVSKVEVYDHTGTYPIKEQRTDYNLSSTYLDRRIIGLPSKTQTYGWNDLTQTLELASELTYVFDGEDFGFETNQVISPIRHDTANFGSSFVAGRGNLTSVTRHDVTSQTAAVTTKTRYDIAGSVVARLDPLNRKVRVEYTDVFNDTVNRNSFAYPTKVYDPANNFSEAKYRFDIGANVWARSPAPAGQTVGKTTLRVFDSIGRLEKETIDNSGAYTRYAYPANGVQSQVYTTIVDTNNNNTGDTADEVLSETWTDGAGRVRRSRTEHPGSVGGWVGSIVEYDILGRTKRSSVPTEISVPNVNNPDSWVPAGDDDRGLDGNGNPIWLWTHQRYDWMGRVVRRIATDGDPNALENDSDVLISYAGCGCAGGLVTTTESESLSQYSEPGVLVAAGRRKQKTYADILGRTFKAEVFNPNGSVYSTVVSKFNERDQVVETKHYQGSDSSGVFQTTQSSFDGHGRLKQSRVPEFASDTYAVWTYNADDSTQSVTDPRGAATHFAYNDPRGLLTGISYSVPQGSGITITPSVSFTFDNAGNRTSMSDGTGTVNYAYDQLSRLQSETRSFTGVSGSFAIGYTYHLGGSLKSVFDPADSTRTVSYAYQKTGELSTMVGNSGTLVENRKITAFGGLKQEDYGNGFKLRQTFDDRLRLSEYRVKNANEQSVSATVFEYNAGNEVIRAIGAYHFDRYYNYDHVGRFSGSFTAWAGNTDYISYDGGAGYDVWNNMTGRSSNIWGYNSTVTSVYQNNRITQVQPWNSHSGQSPIQYWQYDAAGNATVSGGQTHWYDAAGRKIRSLEETPGQQRAAIDIEQTYDGDGRIIKRHEFQVISGGPNITKTEYGLWSSVLGVEVAKVSPAGVRGPDSFFDPSGRKIATMGTAGTKYHHETPFTGSSFETVGQANYVEERQLDPFGGEIPTTPPPSPIPDWIPMGNYQQTGNPLDLQGGCMLSGLPEDCATVAKVSSAHRRDKFRGRSGSEPFPWDAEHRNLPSRIGNWDPRHPIWIPGLDGTPTIASIETFESGGENSYSYTWVRRIRGSRPPQQVPFDSDRIASILEGLLENKKCSDFVNNLLKRASQRTGRKLAENGDISKMFQIVRNNLTRKAPKGSAGFGNPIGSFKNRNAGIFAAATGDLSRQMQLVADVNSIFHELIHLAAYNGDYFSDKLLAELIYDSSDREIPYTGDYSVHPNNPFDTSRMSRDQLRALRNEGHTMWGGYWGRVLYEKCFKDADGKSIDVLKFVTF